MPRTIRCLLYAVLATASLGAWSALADAAPADKPTGSLSGLWDASVTIDTLRVPFKFGIQVNGAQVSGCFFNGDERIVSTSGQLSQHHLLLQFDSYARALDVTVNADGTLDGVYLPVPVGSSRQPYQFHAERAPAASTAVAPAQPTPSLAGLWLVPAPSRKAGEQAWRLIVKQSGSQISAAILRVDGDTGALTGSWQNGHALLSHFDGARPSVIEVSAGPDDSLQLLLRDPHGKDEQLSAYRPAAAKAKGLPEAADPMHHTQVSDPREPLRFSFPDLQGKTVSNTDRRFRGKVIIVDIAGSWCPNCHDEAPFLQALYKKYHRRGLEIVMLSFEEAEQLSNPERLRAFVRQFGISYTVLLAGTPDELHTKLPQAVALDAYPTTFFIGRDGRVQSVHAGFAAPATGSFHEALKKDFTARVEHLLSQSSAPKT